MLRRRKSHRNRRGVLPGLPCGLRTFKRVELRTPLGRDRPRLGPPPRARRNQRATWRSVVRGASVREACYGCQARGLAPRGAEAARRVRARRCRTTSTCAAQPRSRLGRPLRRPRRGPHHLRPRPPPSPPPPSPPPSPSPPLPCSRRYALGPCIFKPCREVRAADSHGLHISGDLAASELVALIEATVLASRLRLG